MQLERVELRESLTFFKLQGSRDNSLCSPNHYIFLFNIQLSYKFSVPCSLLDYNQDNASKGDSHLFQDGSSIFHMILDNLFYSLYPGKVQWRILKSYYIRWNWVLAHQL